MATKDQVQPSDSFAGPLNEWQAASTAGGGTALTTSAVLIPLPKNASHIFLIPRNYATAVVVKIGLNPYLIVLRTTNSLAAATDYSENAQDANTATLVTLNAQDTAANGDYLYVGASVPFRGVKAGVTGANAVVSTLTVKYWNGSAWASTSATDGTASAGATLAQNGDVTWTVPSAWARASLEDIASPPPAGLLAYRQEELYWTRWEVSVQLGATVTLNQMLAYNRSTAYGELPLGLTLEQRIARGPGGTGCIEALTDAGTANLIVNVATQLGGKGLGL